MRMYDVNPENEMVILLIHPMLATGKLLQELLAEPMGKEYRYLIPDLSGHGEEITRTYESAKSEAEQIKLYMEQQGISKIKLAFGASLGAVVLMELLQKQEVQIEHLFFEGVSMFENANILTGILKKKFLGKHMKSQKNPVYTIEKMGELYGERAKKTMAEHLMNITEESLQNIIYDCGHVHLPKLSEEQQKKCVFAFGDKDKNLLIAKKKIKKHYPEAELRVWPDCGHCMRLTKNPEGYAKMLKAEIADYCNLN